MGASDEGVALAKTAEGRLEQLANALREDLETTEDVRFRALAETAAEVLCGLRKAFADYREGDEAAWR